MSRKQHSPSPDNIPGIIVTGSLATGAFFLFFFTQLFLVLCFMEDVVGIRLNEIVKHTTPQLPI